jgi:DMSO/TMAO reductase YedYZ molybdopterin-dependent catalytic subunit
MPHAKPGYMRDFLTPADLFYEITRGRPYQLPPDQRRAAGLSEDTWRLDVVADEPPHEPTLERTFRKEHGTALTLADLERAFRERPVRCIKTMECLMNGPQSGLCSNGLWEGVALRDILARLGRLKNVRRVYYSGFYEQPAQKFVSSLALSDVLETPPGHIPVFLAFRLNGRPLPLERGGPVRMLVPEAYGYKSIKWLNRIVLTNDYRANDTYAEKQNNDPQTPMKTVARIDFHSRTAYRAGEPITIRGVAVVGVSGLSRVEYWLRPDQGTHGALDPDHPDWTTARWTEIPLGTGQPENWGRGLPGNTLPEGVHLVDPLTGRAKVWPLPWSWVPWSVRLDPLAPGAYEFRARTVDQNGFAQPEPRPNPQSGNSHVTCLNLAVT